MTTCGDYSELGPKLDMLETEFIAALAKESRAPLAGTATYYRQEIVVPLMKDVRDYHAQRGTDFPRDLDIGVWEGIPLDDNPGPRSIVVQIDTGDATGRLRVNVNDGVIWDGNPETDETPGGNYQRDWTIQHVSEDVAVAVLRFFEGQGAGHFESLLIRAIMSADDVNKEKLGIGFPEWCRAVGLWLSNKDELHKLAGR
ncbi:hypothetical protein SEA_VALENTINIPUFF_86 [Microbacterium phage ValentiniPuff]|uniref:Uncharacterized protein n=1 Tax=Microbacterium phage ValentiniPuff TaxID=2315705 RepID=A0A386KSB1_9CAUD|nr:hypothetical protein SEA_VALENTINIPUFF_86 [Microbacterium phage ValentiniPuff]